MKDSVLQKNFGIYQRYQQNTEGSLPTRKMTLDPNPYRRTLQKSNILHLGQQQDRKERNVGKIIRNSSNPSAQKQNGKSYVSETPQQHSRYAANLSDKIRYIHMGRFASNFDKTKINQPIFPKPDKQNAFSKKRSSAISDYAANYEKKINDYQVKKEKIDQQIKNIKRVTLNIGSNHANTHVQVSLSETPKFATSQHTIQIVRPNNKPKNNQQSKWVDFLTKMKVQIGLFQTLRSLKHEVQQSDKSKVLQYLRTKHKIIKDIITLDSQEFDPFYNRTAQTNLEELTNQIAAAYEAAQKYWLTNLKAAFEQQDLNDIFTCLEDEGEKGCVSLKGFVRQLGVLLQNQKYLRNRDVYLIYKKIQPFTRQNFLRELSKANDFSKK